MSRHVVAPQFGGVLRLAAASLALALGAGCARSALSASTDPPATLDGAVATGHPLATAAAVEVLEAGGNAADAAVVAAAMLGVVQPSGSGLGGGGFALYRRAGSERVETLDFRETAPADFPVATTAAAGDVKRLQVGGLAVAVPGEVAGLAALAERYGTRPLAALLAPARRVAEEGFDIDTKLAERIASHRALLAQFPASAAIFLDSGEPRRRGTRLVQSELAKTLAMLADRGPAAFYEGPIAEAMVREVERHGGALSRGDLRRYRVVDREPVEGRYRGHRVVSMGPPSSGGVLLLEMLAVLERLRISEMPQGSLERAVLLAESMRHAFADRIELFGDPDFVSVPIAELTSASHTDAIADAIRRTIANGAPSAPPTPESTLPSGTHTTHLSIADGYGNLASVTLTINTSFGSGLTVPGFGIVLNDEMDDFSLGPAAPNAYGLVGSAANRIEPGKRPLSSMTPTLVFDPAGAPFAVLGSPGGPRIISTVLQVLLALIDQHASAAEAVAAPRAHHQAVPDHLSLESGAFSGDFVAALERRGYALRLESPWSDAQLVLRRESAWTAASDPRGGGVGAKTRFRATILPSGPEPSSAARGPACVRASSEQCGEGP